MRESNLSAKVRELQSEPMLESPWSGLEETLAQEGAGRLRLIGYGSLVNADSAAITVDGAVARSARPVMAYGVRRVFDYRMDEAGSRYLPADAPAARALLNVRLTGDSEDVLNGVAIDVPLSDLPALRERESDYCLARILFRFLDDSDADAQTAWILTCVEGAPGGSLRIDRNLTPNPHYYRVCRDGAESFGNAFLESWLRSTFLGDGETSVQEWERTNLSGSTGAGRG